MNKRSRVYRKIYKQYYGEIPKDEDGRSYDIHHIDGDCTNNDPFNLVALSIKEHYELHKKQGDWGAAARIYSRINRDPKEIAELTRQLNFTKSRNGTHWSQIASKNGNHPFQDKEFQKYMADQAKLSGNRAVDKEWTCEKCNCSGKGLSNFSRYHGENCGKKSVSKGRIWVNNGLISKMINDEDITYWIEQGWSRGRGSAELTPRRKNSNGTTGRAQSYVRKTTRSYTKKSK